MIPRFLQIHSLHSYPAALLNRDDSGFAKRLPYGGAMRTRISSQCLKRHWRMAEDEYALKAVGLPMAVRSRHLLDRGILEPLLEAGVPQGRAEAVLGVFIKTLFQESKKTRAKAAEAEEGGSKAPEYATNQAVLLGRPEIDHLLDAARRICEAATDAKSAGAAAEAFIKENRENLTQMKLGSGLEGALFGRMVTSDILARTNAAIHVAHAFTVHQEESESDYFTVVDDLASREETGSAGIFDSELTSGLYYGYVVVDLPTLVTNLEGPPSGRDWLDCDRAAAARVVTHLAHLIAKVSPGAKLGATAPYGWAELMLIEAGSRQPRSLAGAFRQALPKDAGSELLEGAADRLDRALRRLDAMYGCKEARWLATTLESGLTGAERGSFDAVVAAAAAAVAEGVTEPAAP